MHATPGAGPRSRTRSLHTPSRGPTPQQPSLLQPQRPATLPAFSHRPPPRQKHHTTRLERNIFIMAIDSEEFLHLARPVAPAAPGFNTNISPMTVNIQPQVSFLLHLTVSASLSLGSNIFSPPLSRQSSPSSTMPSAATTLPQKTSRPTHPSPASLAP